MRAEVLAVASGGGHWVQLQRIMAGFEGASIVFATTESSAAVDGFKVFALPDANKRTPFRVLYLILKALWLVVTTRPKVVISTGAAPGAVVVIVSKFLGAKILWIDSLANARRLSLSGRIVAPLCDNVLSQWPDVAEEFNCQYRGSIL